MTDICAHIWDQPRLNMVSLIEKVRNTYTCRFCKKEIQTTHRIPCLHKWNTVEHHLGPNYQVWVCFYCGAEYTKLHEKSRLV